MVFLCLHGGIAATIRYGLIPKYWSALSITMLRAAVLLFLVFCSLFFIHAYIHFNLSRHRCLRTSTGSQLVSSLHNRWKMLASVDAFSCLCTRRVGLSGGIRRSEFIEEIDTA